MDNKEAARRLYETLNRVLETGDVSLLDAVMDPRAVDHHPDPGQSPGLDGIKKGFLEFRAAFPDLRFTIEDLIAEGDKVACRLSTRGTHRGTFLGVPATGRDVEQRGIDLLRFSVGRMIERWGEFDTLRLLRRIQP